LTLAKPAVLFDCTRLFLRGAKAPPTGIDRVTLAYARWLLAREDVRLVPVCAWGGRLSPMSVKGVRRIVDRAEQEHFHADDIWERLRAALSRPAGAVPGLRAGANPPGQIAGRARYGPATLRTLANLRPQAAASGALYLNVSHFGLEQPGLLDRATARGFKPVVMIHDLIPIEHPEYCGPSADRWHRRRIATTLEHASLVIANSRSTVESLVRFAQDGDHRLPPVCVAPLGLETAFLSNAPPVESAAPYFLAIGTLEPRKNLTFLLTIWRRLAERMGGDTPTLVLVGRRGWENESLLDQLQRSPPIRRFVHEVSNLQSEQLARLLHGATALLAPSLIEGFDLPVAEAGALGTPVIASDIDVHRELAPDATLLDPLDGPAWLAAIEAAVRSPSPRTPRRSPTWAEHFDIVRLALAPLA
jgi:glycosyltransferase involved in cell wall biosynthesis